jgi:putative chitinase
MDRAAFYAAVRASRLFGGSLGQRQVDGIEYMLTAADHRGTPPKFLAYILATAWHETARTMQPIEELGQGKGRRYGVPTGPYGHVYFGRGLVQLTWLSNYRRAGEAIGVDLVKFPERALDPGNATLILFEGMEQGWFTGKKLADYVGPNRADYRNARRIVNGTDRAEAVARLAAAFEAALSSAGYTGAPKSASAAEREDGSKPRPPAAQPSAPRPRAPIPAGTAPTAATSLIARLIAALLALFGRKA